MPSKKHFAVKEKKKKNKTNQNKNSKRLLTFPYQAYSLSDSTQKKGGNIWEELVSLSLEILDRTLLLTRLHSDTALYREQPGSGAVWGCVCFIQVPQSKDWHWSTLSICDSWIVWVQLHSYKQKQAAKQESHKKCDRTVSSKGTTESQLWPITLTPFRI